eukprot:g55173.t1
MGEPNQLAEQLGELNIGGFWKTWGDVEGKAPPEMKNPRFLVRHLEAKHFHDTLCKQLLRAECAAAAFWRGCLIFFKRHTSCFFNSSRVGCPHHSGRCESEQCGQTATPPTGAPCLHTARTHLNLNSLAHSR